MFISSYCKNNIHTYDDEKKMTTAVNAAFWILIAKKRAKRVNDVKHERFSLSLVFIAKLSGLWLSHDVRLEDFIAWSYDATVVLQVTYN